MHNYYLGNKKSEYDHKVAELTGYHAKEILKKRKTPRITGALAYRFFIDKLYDQMKKEIDDFKKIKKDEIQQAIEDYLAENPEEIKQWKTIIIKLLRLHV